MLNILLNIFNIQGNIMRYQKIDSTHIWKKQHLRRFIAGMIGFGLMMPFTIFIGKKIEAGLFVDVIIATLPVIPFLIAISAFLANIKTMDKMWRKIHSDALIMTALITIAFSFSFGMLQILDVIGRFSIFYIFTFMVIVWSFCFAYVIYKVNGLEEHEE